MIIIETPQGFECERRYVASVIFGEWLGLEWKCEPSPRSDVRISISGHKGAIRLPDVLFGSPEEAWLSESTLPHTPLAWWDSRERVDATQRLVDARVPIIFGDLGYAPPFEAGQIHLPIDVFGSAFFMLTRYEEFVKRDRDEHDRFPALASLAYGEGFLDRPIINDYVEILWAAMRSMWPGIVRAQRVYRMIVSHDVDHPLYALSARMADVPKQMVGDLFRRKEMRLAFDRFRSVVDARRGRYGRDPNNTFSFLMDVSERFGLTSAFYFISAGNSKRDPGYSLQLPWLKALISEIARRGHEVGLHPSYETYKDAEATRLEFDQLTDVARQCGVKQEHWGGRQHYLRWSPRHTWRNWENAQLSYDSTMGYAQCAGFRAGTCYEYSVFDIVERRALRLRERPLVVMETMLLSPRYMNLGREAAAAWAFRLSDACRKADGDFTLLWHNSKLTSRADQALYQDFVARCH